MNAIEKERNEHRNALRADLTEEASATCPVCQGLLDWAPSVVARDGVAVHECCEQAYLHQLVADEPLPF